MPVALNLQLEGQARAPAASFSVLSNGNEHCTLHLLQVLSFRNEPSWNWKGCLRVLGIGATVSQDPTLSNLGGRMVAAPDRCHIALRFSMPMLPVPLPVP